MHQNDRKYVRVIYDQMMHHHWKKGVCLMELLSDIRSVISAVAFLVFVNGCNIGVSGDLEVEHDIARLGMIQGRVTVATIQNNMIAWVGYSGATVTVEGTSFSTSSLQGGTYAIDKIPTGSYNVTATGVLYDYASDVQSVVVRTLSNSIVPDHQLEPGIGNLTGSVILYGKIYSQNGITPFGNQTVTLHRAAYNTSTGNYFPGTVEGTTVTNSDGSYAFYTGLFNRMLTTSGSTIWFMNPDSPVTGYVSTIGIMKRDAYIR